MEDSEKDLVRSRQKGEIEMLNRELETYISEHEEEALELLRELARIPAPSGQEGERARFCREWLEKQGAKGVYMDEAMNVVYPADVPGEGPLEVFMAHMDVVPAGDPGLWDVPPYEPVYRDGRVYGRGTEDNGQSVISSMFSSRAVIDQDLNGMSLGIAYVADEETTSLKGIRYLLDQGVFTDDDIIIVPDWGSPNGSMIEVAEKSVLWLKVSVEGKTCHGSSPQSGLNAYRVSTYLLADLMDRLPARFPARDGMFRPPESTFEPTKRPATVENVNTIPGHDEFCMDMRVLPCYSVDEVLGFVREVASEHADRTGARIAVDIIQCEPAGKASSVSTMGFTALGDAVEKVTGSRPTAVGVGGGTCANFFRMDGFDAYVWQCGGGTLHAPNEYVEMSNLMTDAKVFATLFHDLCVVGRE